MESRMPPGLFVARAHFCLMFNIVFTRTQRSFSANLLSSQSALTVDWCLGLFFPKDKTLLNFMRFFVACFSSLSRYLWMSAKPSGLSATPHSFVSSPNFLRMQSVLSSMSLLKMLNIIGPSIDLLGTPLVTGIQGDFMLLITSLWAQQFSRFLIHLTVYLSSLYFIGLSMRVLGDTVENLPEVKKKNVYCFPLAYT